MSMRYLSLCSGIEAATVAWRPLGWQAAAFSEIEPFPCAVLAHRYPGVPNLGDMTKINGEEYRGAVDLVVGGTPCQDFSVAGKRAGLAGERSGLALHFARLVGEISPRWLFWENVPGAFSTNGGRDFGRFIAALEKFGYGLAWRTLDAQYFGVPQRRRRIFLVGYLGDWRPAAAVLFEPHSLRGDTPPSGKAGAHVTQALTGSLGAGGADDNRAQGNFYVPQIVGQAMSAKWSKGTSGPAGDERRNRIATTLRAEGFDASEDGTGRAVAFQQNQTGEIRQRNIAYTLGTNSNASGRNAPMVQAGLRVRRLTPRECERLQGFPDDYTLIPYRGKPAADCADGPRYKALGNSMAVPVMGWIGERINRVQERRA